jgi:T5orf172 domain-containing protein
MHAILLQATCPSCGTSNRMILSERNSTSPKCGNPKCKAELFEKFAVIFGYVYILSNPGIPKLLKIGQTSGSIQARVNQLSSATGVPHPFVIEAYFASKDPKKDEERLHAALASYRRRGREFFALPLSEALVRCEQALQRKAQYLRAINGEFQEP